jgi:hypothetical protein
MDVAAVTALVGCTDQIIYRAIERGHLKPYRRNPYQFRPETVEKWAAWRATQPRRGESNRITVSTVATRLLPAMQTLIPTETNS